MCVWGRGVRVCGVCVCVLRGVFVVFLRCVVIVPCAVCRVVILRCAACGAAIVL